MGLRGAVRADVAFAPAAEALAGPATRTFPSACLDYFRIPIAALQSVQLAILTIHRLVASAAVRVERVQHRRDSGGAAMH